MLVGPERFERLRAAHVLVIGVGGVGSSAVEALARAPVGRLTLVDSDSIHGTNLNRQIHATIDVLGRPKVEVMAERVRRINPEACVEACVAHCTGSADDGSLPWDSVDFVIDAIDSIQAKVELIATCAARNLPLVSSMGAGGRLDPTQVRIGDLWSTSGCPLARQVRRRLRHRGVESPVRVVHSLEPPIPAPTASTHGERPGTLSVVTMVFGLFCAHAALETLLR
jgi:tRNA A37 threonylcarbamoyladenosine dehydratase